MLVNDPSEIYVGAMTGRIQSYSKIGLTDAGGVSHLRVNRDLSIPDSKTKVPNGWREYSMIS